MAHRFSRIRDTLLWLLLTVAVGGLVRAGPTPVPLPEVAAEECPGSSCDDRPAACDDTAPDAARCCFCLGFLAAPPEGGMTVPRMARVAGPAAGDAISESIRERPPLPPPKG